MRFLDICAGIGGFSLGLEWAGMTCAGQVEIDPFCNRILEKHWPHVPRWKDLKDERSYNEYPAVELVCGGYPCQPFSHAGKRKGAEDDRHIWPYVFKVIQTLRPAWCLFENVAGHVSLGLDQALSDLEGKGYACQSLVIPACAVDAPHRRNRVWIIANCTGKSINRYSGEILREQPGRDAKTGREGLRQADRADGTDFASTVGEVISDINGTGCENRNTATITSGKGYLSRPSDSGGDFWLPEPAVGRMAHGVSNRVDRLRALGNAVVPQLVMQIGLAIIAAS